MAGSLKVSEVAKELKISSKEAVAQLNEHGVEVKGYSSTITDEQAGLLFDIFTQLQSSTLEEILSDKNEEKAKAEKEQKKTSDIQPQKKSETETAEPVNTTKQEEAGNNKKEKVSYRKVSEAVKTDDRAEVAKKAEVKAETKKPVQNIEKKAAEPSNVKEEQHVDKKKKHKQPQKKKSGQRIDLSSMASAEPSEAVVVKTDERKRYVDTRTSTVEIDKIEKRERIEEMVAPDNKYEGGRKKNKKNRQQKPTETKNNKLNKKAQPKPQPVVISEIEVPDTIVVGELAQKMGKTAAEVIKKLMTLGVMATMNQAIDFETAELIGLEFGITVNKEIIKTKEDILLEETEVEDDEKNLLPRPPVVVVMGHVDHGKTSLLDAIRDTSVISTEAGGITQHIGAYSVRLDNRDITFLDTPGHEAFTTMRARGAQVTDVAILVVAADDGIMPQTIEAINHAKAAGVTIVVAINKIDKEGANPERVKQMLMEYELVPEEWGGDTVCVEVSAKKRINIDGLLEMVLLVADMQELKANPNRSASGVVIEAQIDKGRGPVATVLVQNGTLKTGDIVIAGTAVGHVRAMINDKGRRVKAAPPSTPVEILGLSEAPSGGDKFMVVSNEKLARDVAQQRKQEQQESKFNQVVKVSLDNLFSQIDEGNMKELNVIIKADVQGSVEAVRQSLEKLSNEEVRVRAIHGGVGAINESDVMLANASNAIIVGFNVRPDAGAEAAAKQQEVDIRLYRVIYQAIEEIEAAMKGMLEPEYKEVVIGQAEVRQTFKVSGVGTIAGCYVTNGEIRRNASIRLVRDGIVIHEGVIDSLKRFKDDAKEVSEGYECGIGIERFNDIKDGDVIECFIMEEIER